MCLRIVLRKYRIAHSSEVNEFRTSYGNHRHETYLTPGTPLHGDFVDTAANAAARLVAGPGVPHQVTLDFYQETFGPGQDGATEFSKFLANATDGADFVRAYTDFDPVIGFAEAARVPRNSPHDLRYFDQSTIPAREVVRIK